MNPSTVSLAEMVNSSIDVLRNPSVRTFERYERRGNLQSALIYVGVAAILAALFGLSGGIQGAVGQFINVFVSFLLFTGTVYYVGQNQGGTGTFDEVAYTFSLFWVPLSILFSIVVLVLLITIVGICLIPFVFLAWIGISVYFAFLAIQSSMNLIDRTKVWITLGAAALVMLVVGTLVSSILTRP